MSPAKNTTITNKNVANKNVANKNANVINANKNSGMDNTKLSERYRICYDALLEKEISWKKDVIINNTGQKDRVVDEFCQKVIEMAESDTPLN